MSSEEGLSPVPSGCPEAPGPQAAGACACGSPPAPSAPEGLRPWLVGGLPLLALAVLAYTQLEALARGFTASVLKLPLDSRLGAAVAFFVYDAPKVLLLLGAVTFVVGLLQGFVSPEKVRGVLARQGGTWGNLLASLFGIATPFCSCSAVPLFISFVRAGVPLGVTFSYLVAAPMINEVALVMLLAMFGWKIAAIYAGTGITVAFLSGWVLGKLGMERHVEPWVVDGAARAAGLPGRTPQLEDRLAMALQGAKDIVSKAWPYVLIGIGVGAFLHGYIPEGLLVRFMGKDAWWTVPLAVLVGVPLYASTAMVLPIVQTLLAKGAALGSVLAFLMAVTALSLPEVIILRRVLKPRLIALFLVVVTAGILGVGYLFNLLL